MENKIVIITGGCGQVGYATSKIFSENGHTVISLVRKDLDQAIEKMQSISKNNNAILADITDLNSLKLAANNIENQYGRCDVLINAAGISKSIRPVELDELTDDIFKEILNTNLVGSFSTIREFYPLLKKSSQGVIINLSSTSSARASQSNLAYAASKAGIDLITKSLAKALAPNIRVIGISPGYLENATSGIIKPSNANQKFAEMTPLNRVGSGDDIAKSIYSVSENLTYITGQTIIVDGGMTL